MKDNLFLVARVIVSLTLYIVFKILYWGGCVLMYVHDVVHLIVSPLPTPVQMVLTIPTVCISWHLYRIGMVWLAGKMLTWKLATLQPVDEDADE